MDKQTQKFLGEHFELAKVFAEYGVWRDDLAYIVYEYAVHRQELGEPLIENEETSNQFIDELAKWL